MTRADSMLNTPPPSINRKRMLIKSDDNTQFESEDQPTNDKLEPKRGIERLQVTDDINFTKMQSPTKMDVVF